MHKEAELAMIIRSTEERDLQAIADILYERYKPCKWWQVINFEVEKKDWIKTTMNAMRNFSKSVDGASIVVEDKGAVVGSACYLNLTKDFEGLPDRGDTPGEKTAELDKIDDSSFKDELVARYGKALWISEFAVHADYVGKDIAERMMQHIVDKAKTAKMNVALAATPDEIGWHTNWEFKAVHPVRMLMDGTVPATNQMLLELFPATA
ncbi:hypothetical protein QFC21_005685 [Naganishia friedmannii]|uniref:Uncharacterized protein n=1 Tax=Naganishia friedmannii TaxID=89922 RepID=A0ACC2V7H2_9TREE|nr:hypothetical protein QFC21_005685 [Naganishia friedmannii]